MARLGVSPGVPLKDTEKGHEKMTEFREDRNHRKKLFRHWRRQHNFGRPVILPLFNNAILGFRKEFLR